VGGRPARSPQSEEKLEEMIRIHFHLMVVYIYTKRNDRNLFVRYAWFLVETKQRGRGMLVRKTRFTLRNIINTNPIIN
jgi:hypothetical protein